MLQNELIEAIAALDESRCVSITEALVAAGATAEEIFPLVSRGVALVGDKFAAGEFFIGDLIVSGMLVRTIISLLPSKPHGTTANCLGRVVIGVAEGDIHDIGKDIVTSILRVEGFEVIDLGVDVKPSRFVYAVKNYRPNILLISGLMNCTLECMRAVIWLLEEDGLRDQLAIAVGGGVVRETTAALVGADAGYSDPIDTLQFCIDVIAKGRGAGE